MKPSDATIVTTQEPGAVVLAAGGEWTLASAADLEHRLTALAIPDRRRVRIDLAGIKRIDTTGAWLLLRTEHDLSQGGHPVELRNLAPAFAPLFEQVRASGMLSPKPHPRPDHHSLVGFVARIGEVTLNVFARVYAITGFVGVVALTALRVAVRPLRLRLTATVAQMEQIGVNALGIVGLLSLLIGVVIAYQGADQLRRFGAEIYTVDLLAIAMLRELGVLMTAIIIAGRSGSAFTAQIGTMQVTEEIDALRTLGLDPIEVLVMPRLIGLVVTLPMLTFYANLMGLLGGGLMCWLVLGITMPEFVREFQFAVTERTFWLGVAKAPVFATIIAVIGCYEGFRVAGSAESVGRQTTVSVVESIFLVITTDAAFSIMFSILHI